MRAEEVLRAAAQQINAGKPGEAIRICRRFLMQEPRAARVHYALGIALNIAGQVEESIAEFRQAVALKADFYEALTNLGNVLVSAGRLGEAIEAFSEAVRLQPGLAEMHVNLSNVLRDSWRLKEAEVEGVKGVVLKPEMPEAQLCLGAVAACLGEFERAKACYRKAIAQRPGYSAAHMNLGLMELVTGNLGEGWKEYEWRRQCAEAVTPRGFREPQWTGQDVAGKRVLIFPEQGFGDAIFFVRYVPMVAAKGAKVILECAPALGRLFGRVPGVEKLVEARQGLGALDFQCALPSLPHAFGTDLGTIPASVPYLSADDKIVQKWKESIGREEGVRQIGIAWAGSGANRNDRNRSMPLEKWGAILGVKGCRFHSLGTLPPPAGFEVADWSGQLTDFAETAGLIANLDLVISVDTAVGHLAGAMGKPTWLLVAFPPDWRWMLERGDSPWYPTVRLFRQKRAGDWQTVMAEVAGELGRKFETRNSNDESNSKSE
jgi:Flp pilus assembly protein TadD